MRIISALLVAVLTSAALPGAIAQPKGERCFGKRPTIVGRKARDGRLVRMKGTPGDDVILATRGSYVIRARGGNDLICTGSGDDFIKAGRGSDQIRTGAGIDDIWGGRGNDVIRSGRGPAEGLHGGPGDDRLYGGRGHEDYLFGGPGDDLLAGGRGRDIAMYVESRSGVTVDLGAGEAIGEGTDGLRATESVYGSVHDDTLTGDDGPNTLAGGPGNDSLYGRSGDDRLRSGNGGDDLLDGGEGVDAADFYLSYDPVQADLSNALAITSGTDSLADIEDLVGSRFDDVLTGDDAGNAIQGSRGDDQIDGRGGKDYAIFSDSFELSVDLAAGTAIEERGSDTLTGIEGIVGSAFDDSITGDDGVNLFWGGRGDDSLFGASGNDVLVGENGHDSADGGDGEDACTAEIEVDCEEPDTGHYPRLSIDRIVERLTMVLRPWRRL